VTSQNHSFSTVYSEATYKPVPQNETEASNSTSGVSDSGAVESVQVKVAEPAESQAKE